MLSVVGFFVVKEVEVFEGLIVDLKWLFVVVFGGVKVVDKFVVIDNLFKVVDIFVIGGGMVYIFFKVKGFEVGDFLFDEDLIDVCLKYFEVV